MTYFPELQFLDLNDINKEDAEEIHNILYTPRPCRSVFPWVLEQASDWNQHSNYGDGSEGSQEIYHHPMSGMPVATTVQQMYQPQVAVPPLQCYMPPGYVAAAAAAVAAAQGYQPSPPPTSGGGAVAPPQVVYDERRRSSSRGNKPSPKRASNAASGPPAPAPTVTYPVQFPPYHTLHISSPPYGYVAAAAGGGGPGLPSAQHAAGPPLYLAPAPQHIPVYPAPIYPQYPPQVFSPLHDRQPPPQALPPQPPPKPSAPAPTPSSPSLPPLPPPQQQLDRQEVVSPPQPLLAATPSSPPPQEIGSVLSSGSSGGVDVVVVTHGRHHHHHVGGGGGSSSSGGAAPAASAPAPSHLQQQVMMAVTTSLSNNSNKADREEDAAADGGASVDGSGGGDDLMLRRQQRPPSTPSTAPPPPAPNPVSTTHLQDKKATPPTPQVNEGGLRLNRSPDKVLIPKCLPPPLNAIKTTSLSSMKRKPTISGGSSSSSQGMPVNEETAPPTTSPTTTTPTITTPAPALAQAPVGGGGGIRSWAGLFKPGDSSSSIGHNISTTNVLQSSNHQSNSHHHQPQAPLPGSNPTPAESMQGKVKCKPPLNAVAVAPPPSNLVAEKQQVQHQSKGGAATNNDKKLAEMLVNYVIEPRGVILTPRGLNNPSNYCYINATLQALLACAPFYNLLKAISKFKQISSHSITKPPTGTTNTPVIDSMIEFVNEFSQAPVGQLGRLNRKEKSLLRKDGDHQHQLDCVVSAGPSFEPHYVYKMLHTVSSFLPLEGRQEDAEEFLSVLLNGLNDEMIEVMKLLNKNSGASLSNGELSGGGERGNKESCPSSLTSSQQPPPNNHNQIENDDWKEVTNRGIRVTRRTEFGKTPISDIFMGQLRSRLHKKDSPHQASQTTDNIQPFFCLPIDVESSDSVSEALDKLVGWDEIEGEDCWQQHYLEHAPPVLILHLKCFHYSQGRATKISKSLEFPIDLKLDKLVSIKPKMYPKLRNYKLFAVVYHEGKEASKGHYLADVFHVGSSGWIRYDDALVKPVTEQQVLKPRPPRVPYLLYYRRSDTIVQQKYNNNTNTTYRS